MKKILCFDVGGTLIKINARRSFQAIIADHLGIELEEIRRYIKKKSISPISLEQFIYDMGEELNLSGFEMNELNEVLRNHNTRIELYYDTIDTLSELRKRGYTIVVVSNVLSFRCTAMQEIGLKQYILDEIYSFECGYVKPEKGFFHSIEKRLKASAKDMVMIGDSLRADVLGAFEVGWDAIWVDRKNKEVAPSKKRVGDLSDLLKICL